MQMSRWHKTHHVTGHQWILWDSSHQEKRMAPCQAASNRVASGHWCLELPVVNNHILNSTAVLKAHSYLYCAKTLRCEHLLCYWHGVEGCCHSLGLHLSSKHKLADVIQQIIFWRCKWKFGALMSWKCTRYGTTHIKEISYWSPS